MQPKDEHYGLSPPPCLYVRRSKVKKVHMVCDWSVKAHRRISGPCICTPTTQWFSSASRSIRRLITKLTLTKTISPPIQPTGDRNLLAVCLLYNYPGLMER